MGRNWGEIGEKDFRAKLTAINENLDSVKLRVKDGKIYIRGTFPPRPGETENVRTDLATGCSATPAGLRVAKMKAEDINLQLLNDRFDWTPFLKGRLKHLKPASTIGEWLPLSAPGKRSRQLCVMAYAALATFVELPAKEIAELRRLGKGYSPKSVDPRTLPTDNEILDIWSCISDPGWRWIYAAISLYGLRSHEVFKCFNDRLQENPPILEIQEETKTGRRQDYPCPGDGWGAFTPLDFRHAYARRMYRKGFDSGFSAKSMGHSRDVHERIYSAWWGDEPYLERYKKVMGIEEKDGSLITVN